LVQKSEQTICRIGNYQGESVALEAFALNLNNAGIAEGRKVLIFLVLFRFFKVENNKSADASSLIVIYFFNYIIFMNNLIVWFILQI